MTHLLLFVVFFVLFASRALGFDTSLAPGLSVKNAFLYLLFVGLAIETAVTRRRRLELMPVFVPMFLYAAYATFSWLVVVLIIDYPGYSAWASLISLKGGPMEDLLVLLVFFYGITDAKRALWLLRSMTWLVIIGNVVTVLDSLGVVTVGLHQEEDGRVGGTIGAVNEYGAFLAFMLPLVVANYLTDRGLWKVLAGLGVLCSGVAFLMAMSRGAIVGLAAGGLIGAYYLRATVPAQTVVRTAIAVGFLCVVVVIGTFMSGYGDLLAERFGRMGGSTYEAGSGRTMIWGKAIADMLNQPVSFLTGFGWFAYNTFSPSGFATHNVYLYILYNLGMIGVALFLVTAGNVLRTARRALEQASASARPWLVAFVFGFLALLVTIFFGNFGVPWLYVWGFVGISLRLAVAESTTEPTSIAVRSDGLARPLDASVQASEGRYFRIK